LICETFKAHAGVNILHVPYRGTGESMPDFLAGVVHIQTDQLTFAPHIVAGKAKLLAVLGHERRPDFPNVPLLKEIYPAMDSGCGSAYLPRRDTPIDRRDHELRDE
jgi:tripartite-type tricarboxylate transporter receptor subunit TctC